MKLFADVAFHSLKKFGEELCGDMVEIVRLKHSTIIVLADGLGSGVKANILATLTTKISATMLKEGIDIYETVDTIIKTLPVCRVRKIAYCTFTLIKIQEDGKVNVVEYDNPPFFCIRDGNERNINKKPVIINGKTVYESKFYVQPGEVITVVSDGAIHVGTEKIFNLNWNWNSILDYLKRNIDEYKSASNIAKDLIQTCFYLYGEKPTDDTTVLTVKIREPEYIQIFTGPPKDRKKDERFVEKFMNSQGKKIVCGGTAANIIERETGEKVKVHLNSSNSKSPPVASMKEIYLITEGIITLNKVVENLKRYKKSLKNINDNIDFLGEDGASILTRTLILRCTNVTIWFGETINSAHEDLHFPFELSIKLKVITELKNVMKSLGKNIEIIEI